MKSIATRNVSAILALTVIAWFGVLSWISTRTHYGFVFSDETAFFLPMALGYSDENYRLWSILPAYPSFLYFRLGSWLPLGDLYAGAKLLNAFFISATALPAYLVARRYLDTRLAAVFAIVVMVSPVASFVRYVMPEPVYFFGFWCVLMTVLSTVERSPYASALIGGALIGMLSLIKPHALALTLGLGGFFLLRAIARRSRASLIAALIQFGAYYAARAILARQLTGNWTWAPSSYDSMLSGHGIDLLATMHNAFGHLCALLILIAIPLAITIAFVMREWNTGRSDEGQGTPNSRLWDLGLLACCLLAAMLAMTVYFSQSVYQIHPESERIVRLHGRYYFYALPLFPLLLLGLRHTGRNLRELISAQLFLVLSLSTIVAAVCVAKLFEVGPVDFPDLSLFYKSAGLIASLGVFCVMAAILYFGRKNPDSSGSYLATVAWWAGVTTLTSVALLFVAPMTERFKPRSIDTAFAASPGPDGLHGLIGRDDGIVFGPPAGDADIYRVMFYLRSRSAGKVVPDGTTLTDSDIPATAHWAILLPGTEYSGSNRVSTEGPLSVVWRKN